MLNTNLLPQEEKKLVRLEETRRVIIFFAALIVAVFITGSVLSLPSFLALYLERRELERALKLEEEASQKLKVRETLMVSKKIGSSVAAIKELISDSPKATLLFENLLGSAAPTIVLANLDIKKTGEITLSGFAPTRLDLLNFEKKLRDSGLFQEISSPLSNIVREASINFTMQGKLKPRYNL